MTLRHRPIEARARGGKGGGGKSGGGKGGGGNSNPNYPSTTSMPSGGGRGNQKK